MSQSALDKYVAYLRNRNQKRAETEVQKKMLSQMKAQENPIAQVASAGLQGLAQGIETEKQDAQFSMLADKFATEEEKLEMGEIREGIKTPEEQKIAGKMAKIGTEDKLDEVSFLKQLEMKTISPTINSMPQKWDITQPRTAPELRVQGSMNIKISDEEYKTSFNKLDELKNDKTKTYTADEFNESVKKIGKQKTMEKFQGKYAESYLNDLESNLTRKFEYDLERKVPEFLKGQQNLISAIEKEKNINRKIQLVNNNKEFNNMIRDLGVEDNKDVYATQYLKLLEEKDNLSFLKKMDAVKQFKSVYNALPESDDGVKIKSEIITRNNGKYIEAKGYDDYNDAVKKYNGEKDPILKKIYEKKVIEEESRINRINKSVEKYNSIRAIVDGTKDDDKLALSDIANYSGKSTIKQQETKSTGRVKPQELTEQELARYRDLEAQKSAGTLKDMALQNEFNKLQSKKNSYDAEMKNYNLPKTKDEMKSETSETNKSIVMEDYNKVKENTKGDSIYKNIPEEMRPYRFAVQQLEQYEQLVKSYKGKTQDPKLMELVKIAEEEIPAYEAFIASGIDKEKGMNVKTEQETTPADEFYGAKSEATKKILNTIKKQDKELAKTKAQLEALKAKQAEIDSDPTMDKKKDLQTWKIAEGRRGGMGSKYYYDVLSRAGIGEDGKSSKSRDENPYSFTVSIGTRMAKEIDYAKSRVLDFLHDPLAEPATKVKVIKKALIKDVPNINDMSNNEVLNLRLKAVAKISNETEKARSSFIEKYDKAKKASVSLTQKEDMEPYISEMERELNKFRIYIFDIPWNK